MKYLTLLVLLIATHSVLSQGTTTNTAANYCVKGLCGQCSLQSLTGIRSCSGCVSSVKTLVSTGVYQCASKNSIENCFFYFDSDNTNYSGCHFCKDGYGSSTPTTVNGKQHYTCVKINDKINNCVHTVRVVTELLCIQCQKEFKLNEEVTACLSASSVANCIILDQTAGKCDSCAKGYVESAGVCLPEGEFKGCKRLNTSNKCLQCDVNHKFYAVDDTAERGNKCEFMSRLSLLGKILAAVFLVQLTSF